MTKEELKQEFEKYLKASADYYDPREPLTERKLLQIRLDCAEPREKRIASLEQENAELKAQIAELKKNYEESLVACKVLKEKIDLMTGPSPIESMQDVLITVQKEQLTKAKEIIRQFLNDYPVITKELLDKLEQFVKECKE